MQVYKKGRNNRFNLRLQYFCFMPQKLLIRFSASMTQVCNCIQKLHFTTCVMTNLTIIELALRYPHLQVGQVCIQKMQPKDNKFYPLTYRATCRHISDGVVFKVAMVGNNKPIDTCLNITKYIVYNISIGQSSC